MLGLRTEMAKMATVALLSATVAFGHPGYANAGLFGGGEKVGKYAEDDTARYMREIEEARCVRWINPPRSQPSREQTNPH